MAGKNKYNKELQSAVRALYENNLIEKDKDIAGKMGLAPTTVSGYISGALKASESFLRKFEKTFEVKVPREADDESSDVALKYTRLLEKQNDLLTNKLLSINQEVGELGTSLKECREMLSALAVMVSTNRDVIFDSLTRIEKKAKGSLHQEGRKKVTDKFEKLKQQGIGGLVGN